MTNGGDMEDCVFCKMFTGEVETRKVYEGRDVIGILDVAPRFAQGQCVVIHRRHVAQFYDLEDEELTQLFVAVKAVAEKIREAFGTPLVSIFSRGIAVPIHSHVVVYPSNGEGPMDRVMAAFLAAEAVRRTSPAQLDEIAEKIRRA
jgi:histidine triad (HIT) family protein